MRKNQSINNVTTRINILTLFCDIRVPGDKAMLGPAGVGFGVVSSLGGRFTLDIPATTLGIPTALGVEGVLSILFGLAVNAGPAENIAVRYNSENHHQKIL